MSESSENSRQLVTGTDQRKGRAAFPTSAEHALALKMNSGSFSLCQTLGFFQGLCPERGQWEGILGERELLLINKIRKHQIQTVTLFRLQDCSVCTLQYSENLGQ